jgi:hypothetical protein
MTVTVEFPLPTPNMTNRREHHMARARRQKKQRDATVMLLKLKQVAWRLSADATWWPLEGVLVVTLTRVSSGVLDAHDNLRSALKSVVDGVADYFEIDDADPRITWVYKQAKGKAAVRIEFDVVRAPEARAE